MSVSGFSSLVTAVVLVAFTPDSSCSVTTEGCFMSNTV